jgi:hypothetical protein
VVQRHYTDPEVVALAARMVCVIGNIGNHAPAGMPCPKFGTITCEQHRADEIKARETYIRSDVARAPQHIFCGPDGAELFRKVYLIPKADLAKAMAIAIAGKSPAPDATTHDVLVKERTKVEALIKDLGSNNLEVRNAAFRGLATADDPRALPAILERAKPANEDSIRYCAILALGVKGNHGAIKPLLGFLGDRSSRIVAATISALEKIELPDPVPDLLARARRERSDRIRGRLLSAMAKCLPESPEVQKLCLAALKGCSSQLEGWVLTSLFALAPDPKIIVAVKPLLEAKKEATRALAAWVIGKQRDPKMVQVLEKMIAKEKSPEVLALLQKALACCRGQEVEGYDALSGRFFWASEDM